MTDKEELCLLANKLDNWNSTEEDRVRELIHALFPVPKVETPKDSRTISTLLEQAGLNRKDQFNIHGFRVRVTPRWTDVQYISDRQDTGVDARNGITRCADVLTEAGYEISREPGRILVLKGPQTKDTP